MEVLFRYPVADRVASDYGLEEIQANVFASQHFRRRRSTLILSPPGRRQKRCASACSEAVFVNVLRG